MAFRKETTTSHGYDYLFKILLIGEYNKDATDIILRLCDDSYSESFISAIGVDFKTKTLEMNKQLVAKLQLWPITVKLDNFNLDPRSQGTGRGAHAYFVICDLTKPDLLANKIEIYMDRLTKWNYQSWPIIFVGVNADQVVDLNQLDKALLDIQHLAEVYDCGYAIVNAKRNSNINELFFETTKRLIEINEGSKPSTKVQLSIGASADEIANLCLSADSSGVPQDIINVLVPKYTFIKYAKPPKAIPHDILLKSQEMEADYFSVISEKQFSSEGFDNNPLADYYRMLNKLDKCYSANESEKLQLLSECQQLYKQILGFSNEKYHDAYDALKMYARGLIYQYSERLSLLNTSSNIKENTKLNTALSCHMKAYELGYVGAIKNIGMVHYELGNFKEADKYLRLAIDTGAADSYTTKYYELRKSDIEEGIRRENDQDSKCSVM